MIDFFKRGKVSDIDFGISQKDIWDKLYIRLESDNQLLWSRLPLFITMFGFTLTGYGYILMQLINVDVSKANNVFFYHVILIVICLIAYVISLFWVIISKGSRYWFERINESIHAIERPRENELIWDKTDKKNPKIKIKSADKELTDSHEKHQEYKKIFQDNFHKTPYNLIDLAPINENKSSGNIFGKAPYHYSLGTTQMFMGQLLMQFWGLLTILHSFVLFTPNTRYYLSNITNWLINLPMCGQWVIGIIGIIVMAAVLKVITWYICYKMTTDNTSNYTLIRKQLGIYGKHEKKPTS